jgi:hypothetical protein
MGDFRGGIEFLTSWFYIVAAMILFCFDFDFVSYGYLMDVIWILYGYISAMSVMFLCYVDVILK